MRNHLPILPILIPFAAALLQMADAQRTFQRAVGLLSTSLLLLVTGWLTLLADDGLLRVYALVKGSDGKQFTPSPERQRLRHVARLDFLEEGMF